MAGKKVIKKGKKAGGKIVPGDGEQKGSPKVSPKTSPKTAPAELPKQSPKQSPKVSPQVSPKEAKKLKKAAAAKPEEPAEAKAKAAVQPNKPGKAAPRPPPSAEEKKKATAEVIRLIKEGVKKEPEVQEKGLCWIPKDWSTKWKPILGGYRKFVAGCACFRVQDTSPSNFIIHVVEGGAEGTRPEWEVFLNKAASLFAQTEKDPKEFSKLAQALASEPKPTPIAPKGAKRKAEANDAKPKAKAEAESKKKAKNRKAKKAKGGGGEEDEE